jgi:Tfp pilus assembly protein FimT
MANWKSKIQLTRKNVVYQNNQNVRIIIQPSQVKTQHITSNRFVIQPNKQTPQNTAKQVKPPQQAAIAKITPTKRKTSRKTQIKYIKHQPNPESIAKIQNIQNTAFNRTLVIVGNGPSISEIPLEKIKDTQNIDVLSINTPDHRIWPTSHWAFFDVSQLRRHESLWNNYDGYIFNSTAIKRQKQKKNMIS